MIRVEGVSFGYRSSGMVLDDVSFDVSRGEKVVLLGCNGSGKTTLLRILDGLIFPTRGYVAYDGIEVTRKTLQSEPLAQRFRREVVLLFQNPEAMIFNPTVYDEIAFGLRRTGAQGVDETTRRWADTLGLARHLDRPAFELSRGEIQKVCLAALLALEPRVLLLDEPTASLDPRSTGWLIDFLQDLDQTVVVTTHNLSMAHELGERTLVLSEDHRIIYDGTIEGLTGDTDTLVAANLVHVHRHRHGDIEHRHFHTHEWD
jgi:cobalt/nickel transport system ATP-binding protein